MLLSAPTLSAPASPALHAPDAPGSRHCWLACSQISPDGHPVPPAQLTWQSRKPCE
jgi:hypothetical protein